MAGEATGTAGSGIHWGFLWTTRTSALRLSSSTWLNYLQAEHPTGRDQALTGRDVVPWHMPTPRTSENTTVAHLWGTAVWDRAEGSQRQEQQTFCRVVVMIQARKSQVSQQKEEQRKTSSKHKSLFCPLPPRLSFLLWPTSQILQSFLQLENWLTWAQGRHSPDTTGRIYSSVCVAAPLGLQHWKHRQVVEDKVVNRREGNNEDRPGGLRETIWLFPLTHSPT